MRNVYLILIVAAAAVAAPPDVPVIKPIQRETPDVEQFAGRIEASETVEVRSRVTGYLTKVHFEEGAEVKKGDLLFQIDERVQKAELDRAQAELALADAKLKLADTTLQRAKKLQDISKEEYEKSLTEVEAAKAGVAAAKAAVEAAKLNLEYTRITAPIAGRVSRKLLDVGNLVSGGDSKNGPTLLTTIVVLDPLYVSFDIPEPNVLRFLKKLKDAKETKLAVEVHVGSHPDSAFPAEVRFLDNKVNTETGSIVARATLANPKRALYPGLYARVLVKNGPPRKALLVPERAVVNAHTSPKLFVLGAKNILEEREVKLGALGDGLRVIEAGLKADDMVVLQPFERKAGEEIKPVVQKAPPAERKASASALRPPTALPGDGPALIVSASYPGANANTVEQAIAAPLLEQLRGLEDSTRQFVECTDTGEMRITICFKKKTDLSQAMIVTQNRIALAEPAMPEDVRKTGFSVTKRPVHLAAVALVCTDGSKDRKYLTNYAELRLKDDFARAEGVADVSFHGDPLPAESVQIHIDRDRLRALGMTANEVHQALDAQKLLGRKTDPESMSAIIVKSLGEGKVVYLRDVARLEVVAAPSSLTSLDGKPCVMLLVSRTADAESDKTMKALNDAMAKLKKVLPAGLALEIVE